ncbi:DUF6519 domain-containing protein [Microbacterium deminutum]|uniref:Uncharacterized protein n=1 Tax=Microbacterium deminutum TaxID=344164 RepID=A0ABN2QLS3_9MICO
MATDVARLSFDPARRYRGVVAQQGRVSLEAEANEQRTIDIEEQRAEVIDIVGPVGTPDDGYAVSSGTGFELTIGPGTMYVGGWRVTLAEALGDYHQPDWLDRPRGWKETGREHVLLTVTETDVTAVEDPALYEVALGGPDGAARSRLLQHIERHETDAATCADAIAEDIKHWLQEGLRYDPETAALLSDSRLLVTWEADPAPPDPCEPTSTGGYLGAENQLLRVQLTRIAENGRFDIVWGYDDASFLYRVTADASTNPVLTLDRSPADDFHRPRAGQAVQVLRATAELASTDAQVEGYVAALAGQVGVLTAPYDPDLKTVTFPAPLPSAYTDGDQTPQLYLRVWEEQITDAELGQPIRLGSTGVQVTITADAGGNLHVDDFWCIGVRPSTPTAVYPARLLRTPQPPDGPRQWVAPLAVIEWREREFDILEDCRHPFQPLTELDESGCCTIEVRPSHAADGTLQARIDRAVAGRTIAERGDRVKVCFTPGRYELLRPIILTQRHSNLTLDNCNEAAVLAVRRGSEKAFGHGMIILVDADNITVSGLEFELPQIPAVLARVSGTTGGLLDREAVRGINAEQANRWVSIGVRAINCAVLAVRRCLFRFTVGEHQTEPEDAQTMPRNVFGVGVFAAGGAWGFELTGNRFLHDPTTPVAADGPFHLLVGYLLTQTALSRSGTSVSLGASRLPGLLDAALIAGNEFRGLSAAVLVAAGIGDIRVWDNVVSQCYGGLWFLDAAALFAASKVDPAAPGGGLATAASAGSDSVLLRILVLAMVYPLPDVASRPSRGVLTFTGAALTRLREASNRAEGLVADRFMSRIAGEQPDAPAVATARVAVSPNVLAAWRGLATLNRLDPKLTARAGGEEKSLPAAVGIQRNTVDCAAPDAGPTGFALIFIAAASETGDASVTVTGNRFTSPDTLIVAAVSGAGAASVTGNIVASRGGDSPIALAVLATQAAAITGNVVIGRALLPPRTLPAPLDTWLPFNEISL